MSSSETATEFEPFDGTKTYHGPLPALGNFRANPTQETHQEAAALLHRCGPLVLGGDLFELVDGRVKFGPAPDNSRGVMSR